MGGQTGSTLQGNGSQISQLFGGNAGYQQPNQIAPAITQPQYGGPLQPSPEQAAAATQARMLARSPLAAPSAAPRQNFNYSYTPSGAHNNSGGERFGGRMIWQMDPKDYPTSQKS